MKEGVNKNTAFKLLMSYQCPTLTVPLCEDVSVVMAGHQALH